jgi:putative transposase
MDAVKLLRPYEMIAYVIMPDHMHLLIETPEDSPNYSPIISSIKRNFIRNYRRSIDGINQSPIWQVRFWDHVIKDDKDFERHLDYIHWNPVKHGYVNDPIQWKWSTFGKWLMDGFYDEQWGEEIPDTIQKMDFE